MRSGPRARPLLALALVLAAVARAAVPLEWTIVFSCDQPKSALPLGSALEHFAHEHGLGGLTLRACVRGPAVALGCTTVPPGANLTGVVVAVEESYFRLGLTHLSVEVAAIGPDDAVVLGPGGDQGPWLVATATLVAVPSEWMRCRCGRGASAARACTPSADPIEEEERWGELVMAQAAVEQFRDAPWKAPAHSDPAAMLGVITRRRRAGRHALRVATLRASVHDALDVLARRAAELASGADWVVVDRGAVAADEGHLRAVVRALEHAGAQAGLSCLQDAPSTHAEESESPTSNPSRPREPVPEFGSKCCQSHAPHSTLWSLQTKRGRWLSHLPWAGVPFLAGRAEFWACLARAEPVPANWARRERELWFRTVVAHRCSGGGALGVAFPPALQEAAGTRLECLAPIEDPRAAAPRHANGGAGEATVYSAAALVDVGHAFNVQRRVEHANRPIASAEARNAGSRRVSLESDPTTTSSTPPPTLLGPLGAWPSLTVERLWYELDGVTERVLEEASGILRPTTSDDNDEVEDEDVKDDGANLRRDGGVTETDDFQLILLFSSTRAHWTAAPDLLADLGFHVIALQSITADPSLASLRVTNLNDEVSSSSSSSATVPSSSSANASFVASSSVSSLASTQTPTSSSFSTSTSVAPSLASLALYRWFWRMYAAEVHLQRWHLVSKVANGRIHEGNTLALIVQRTLPARERQPTVRAAQRHQFTHPTLSNFKALWRARFGDCHTTVSATEAERDTLFLFGHVPWVDTNHALAPTLHRFPAATPRRTIVDTIRLVAEQRTLLWYSVPFLGLQPASQHRTEAPRSTRWASLSAALGAVLRSTPLVSATRTGGSGGTVEGGRGGGAGAGAGVGGAQTNEAGEDAVARANARAVPTVTLVVRSVHAAIRTLDDSAEVIRCSDAGDLSVRGRSQAEDHRAREIPSSLGEEDAALWGAWAHAEQIFPAMQESERRGIVPFASLPPITATCEVTLVFDKERGADTPLAWRWGAHLHLDHEQAVRVRIVAEPLPKVDLEGTTGRHGWE